MASPSHLTATPLLLGGRLAIHREHVNLLGTIPRLLITKNIPGISHTNTASPFLKQIQRRDLDMDTMSLVLLSGLCLDSEASARLRVRAEALPWTSCFLE